MLEAKRWLICFKNTTSIHKNHNLHKGRDSCYLIRLNNFHSPCRELWKAMYIYQIITILRLFLQHECYIMPLEVPKNDLKSSLFCKITSSLFLQYFTATFTHFSFKSFLLCCNRKKTNEQKTHTHQNKQTNTQKNPNKHTTSPGFQ